MRTLFFLFGLILLSYACSGPTKITQKGLSFAKLGAPMPKAGTSEINGRSSRDTLYDEGGFQWRALIVSYGEKEVYIEEDFGGQGLINRIRVESHVFSASRNKKVGMSWLDLSKLGKNWDAIYLKDYGVWDVISPTQSRIHFLLKETRDTATIDLNGGVSSILKEAKVSSIVIM